MEKSRASLPMAVAAMATLMATADTRASLKYFIPCIDCPPPSYPEQSARMRAVTGLVHKARAEIQRSCSTDWWIFTDRAIESDYREENEREILLGQGYVRVEREIAVDDDRIRCAERILEVLNRRYGSKFNAELSLGGWDFAHAMGSDPVPATLEARSPRPSFVDI